MSSFESVLPKRVSYILATKNRASFLERAMPSIRTFKKSDDELIIIDHGRLLAQGSPVDLIKQHCETDVVEIRGDAALAITRDLPESFRCDRSGDSLYIYSSDTSRLLEWTESLQGLTSLHRKTGLEDVFLRLTGRGLR